MNPVSPEATELDDPKHSVYKKKFPADAKFMCYEVLLLLFFFF